MAERTDAEVYCHVGKGKTYVCPDEGQNFDPDVLGRGRAVGMRRKEAMTGFKMGRGQSVDFTGLEVDKDKGPDDEDYALLSRVTPPTDVDVDLGDVRQSVFAVDSTTLSIAEALNSTGEFDVNASELALTDHYDMESAEADSVPNIRGAAEDAIAHLGLDDLGQQVFLNHAETVRGDRSTTDASVSQAFDRLLNEPDGLTSLKEAMDGLVPLNTPKQQKRYPGTTGNVEVSS